MRRTAAARELQSMAEACTRITDRHAGGWGSGPMPVAAYAYGDVLDPTGPDPALVRIALVLDLPPEDLPWQTNPPSCADLPYWLGLEKAPVAWVYRSAAMPVDNHVVVRPLLVWSPQRGVETGALDALVNSDVEALRLPAADPAELRARLEREAAVSVAHLSRVRDGYWEHSWRSEHSGGGVYPEQHLWDAVNGYLDLARALHGVAQPA